MIPDGTHVVSEVDRERDFVISYFLVDDSMSIYEAPKRNLGLTGGRFLARGPAPKKPGTNKPYQVRTASRVSVPDYYFKPQTRSPNTILDCLPRHRLESGERFGRHSPNGGASMRRI
jgi:hypothetical protein